MDSNEALQEAYGLLQRAVELIELGGWPVSRTSWQSWPTPVDAAAS
jgi:hypothetical protein